MPLPPAQFAGYLERDGAPEVCTSRDHGRYVEQAGATELPDSELSQDVSTKPGSSDRFEGASENASIFSNISDDPKERIRYWRLVEERESTPQVHALLLKPAQSPDWWAGLSTTIELDEDFQAHALKVAEEYRQSVERRRLAPEEVVEFKIPAFICSAEKAGMIIEQVRGMQGVEPKAFPLFFKSGRGGRTQYRFVCELPCEISPQARAEIAQEFCRYLGALEQRPGPNGDQETVGMMYTGVVHAPDAHNDHRNFHLHVIAHDRPAKLVELEDGSREWDFACRVEYVTPRRQRRSRYRHPVINKVRSVNSKDFIPTLRKKFADIVNGVLQKHGIARRFDPRSYEEMGIGRTPTRHLGTEAAALESVGIPTTVGQSNAIIIWSDAERSIEEQIARFEEKAKREQDSFQGFGFSAALVDENGPETSRFFSLLGRREILIETTAASRLALLIFDLHEAKAKSCAARTLRTCQAYLAAIDTGDADPSTKARLNQIEARSVAAQSHLTAIDAALASHRVTLMRVAEKLATDEEELRRITRELWSAVPGLQAIVKHGAPLRRTAEQRPAHKIEGDASNIEASTGSAPVEPPRAAETFVSGPEMPGCGALPTIDARPITEPTIKPIQQALKVNDLPLSDMARNAEESRHSASGVGAGSQPAMVSSKGSEAMDRERPEALETSNLEESSSPANEGSELADHVGNLDGPRPEAPEISERPDAQDQQVSTQKAEAVERPQPVATCSPKVTAPEAVDRQNKTRRQPSVDACGAPKNAAARRGAESEIPDPVSTRSGSVGAVSDRPADTKVRAKIERQGSPKNLPGASPSMASKQTPGWRQVIERIEKERLTIRCSTKRKLHWVRGLSETERKIVSARPIAARTQAQLRRLFAIQEKEISGVIEWLEMHGSDREMLKLSNGEVALGAQVPEEIQSLFYGRIRHPKIRRFVRTEHQRRVEEEEAEEQNVIARLYADRQGYSR